MGRTEVRTSEEAASSVGRQDRSDDGTSASSPGPDPTRETISLGRSDIANMIEEALKETVARMTEARGGRSVVQGLEPSYLEREAGIGEGLILGRQTSAHQLHEVGVSAGVGNVTSSMRQKIISHKYVDLKALLLSNEKSTVGDKRQYLVAEGGRISLGPDPHKDDLSVNGWTKAFFALRRSVHPGVSDRGRRHYPVYVHGDGFDIKGPGKGMEGI